MIAFAADLHLSAATPGIAGLFIAWLDGFSRQPDAEALYLLGDVFEAWPGDDDLASPCHATIARALRHASERGLMIGFLPGNRDFLIGEQFAVATGVRLLEDPYTLSVPAWQFVLTHGDALCTDDLPYQQFRQMVRDPAWQARFLAQPLAERQAQVAAIRARSEAQREIAQDEQRAASMALTDVNGGTVADFLQQHGYATLIHGHTHRPATHDHIVDGIHCQRWVLADWHETGKTADGQPSATGEVLLWDRDALRRHPLRT